jgi:transcriptional antiterminator RfaH
MTTDHPPANAAWFCVRTHSKREHVAARWLQRYLHIDAYVPRIRFRRSQPRGPVWFIEALFPNYLFARFDPDKSLQHIDYAPGIRGVVRFGAHCPAIPEDVIESLRATVGADQVHVIDQQLQPGETVQLAGGLFHGLEAVVARVIPAQERVAVLLEFLGRQTMVELSALAVARLGDERQRVFQ